VEQAAAGGLAVAPWCPFARRFLRRNPDVAASVRVDWSPPPTGDPRMEEHLDEQEMESFPASDPHSDWAGVDRP
jgi:hypothetical protein